MPKHVLKLILNDEENRRWVAFAGRKGMPTEAWVYEVITQVIEAEEPGKKNRVLSEIALTPPTPAVRYCEFCGNPLPSFATARRRYCNDRCRVGGWRRNQRA